MENLTIEQRLQLVNEVGEEVVTAEELRKLLEEGKDLIAYDGFEPSGQMHIAQGILRAINVNKMAMAGFTFKMWVADWFAYLNNKMGGDMDKIHKTGEYFVEVWKAAGMDLENVVFEWTSDYVKKPEYWELVLKIAKANSLKRILKTTQIMGRTESDDLSAAQIFYPCMQAADIFMLGARVAQLGMDQRKVNMLAREVGPELGYWKPISVSHHMLQGLGKPAEKLASIDETFVIAPNDESKDIVYGNDVYTFELGFADGKFHPVLTLAGKSFNGKFIVVGENSDVDKLNVQLLEDVKGSMRVRIRSAVESLANRAIDMKMSKSVPDTAIFMTDSREDVLRKINKAYCPEGEVNENPILDYCKHIIFEAHYLKGREDFLANGFEVKRPEKFGGDVTYKTYAELEQAYASKELFPLDLKNAVAEYIDQLLQPVREHFTTDQSAKGLLNEVQSFQVTR